MKINETICEENLRISEDYNDENMSSELYHRFDFSDAPTEKKCKQDYKIWKIYEQKILKYSWEHQLNPSYLYDKLFQKWLSDSKSEQNDNRK